MRTILLCMSDLPCDKITEMCRQMNQDIPEESSANKPLKVLLVEDDPADAELCVHVLRKAHQQARVETVQTRDEFSRQLRTNYFDVILADYWLGGWTGLDAFELMQRERRKIPFILVTGALGDEKAIECMRKGLTDYVLKDHLDRLPVAISRALEERLLSRQHEMAERALRENEEKFRTLADALPAAVFIEQGTECRYVNHAAETLTGFTRKDLEGMNFWQLVVPDSRKRIMKARRFSWDTGATRYELQICTSDRRLRWLDVTVGMFQLEGSLAALITAFDITERKRSEIQLSLVAS